MLWNSYRYKIVDDTVHILQYIGEETRVCIPDQIGGYPVVEIGPDAFSEYGAGIEQVEVPASVKIIGKGAFRMCMCLTDLILHEGLEVLGEGCLYVAPITRLHIPSTVRYIEMPSELGEISWEVDEKNPYYFTDGYALYYRKHEKQELVIVQKNDSRREYEILEGTTAVGPGSFGGHAYIEKVIFPDSVTVIEEDAFESCQALRQVVLNEGLLEIQADVFSYCVNLESISLPASLKVLGAKALTNTFGWSDKVNGIGHIDVAPGNPVFYADGNGLFERMADGGICLVKYFGKEREYSVPRGVTRVGWSACRRAGFKKLIIPDSVKVVEKKAFSECKNLVWISVEKDGAVLYVPQTPVYRKDEITRLFATDAGEEIYDYAGYDGLFDTYFYLTDKGKMACCRLKDPVKADIGTLEKYKTYIRENLSDILKDISEREDVDQLANLAELGFFTEENMDRCIDEINRCRSAKLMSFLMNYKQEHFDSKEFDFSL